MALHAIDVGQGDAYLLEFRCGAILVDVGGEKTWDEYPKRLVDYLDWFFDDRRPELDRTLHGLVLSHSHEDHVFGVRYLFETSLEDSQSAIGESLTTLHLVDNGYDHAGGRDEQIAIRNAVSALGEDAAISVSVPRPSSEWGETSLAIDPISACDRDAVDPDIRVLWGGWKEATSSSSSPNHHSVVLRVDYGESSILLTGDLQTPGGINAVVGRYSEVPVLDVDVLKVGHHGANNGVNKALLELVTPCLATMGVGKPSLRTGSSAWDHGHPRSAATALLTQHVSGRRKKIHIAQFPAENVEPEWIETESALYGTGWDGHHVIYLSDAGNVHTVTEMGADEEIRCEN